ncbi:MAG: DUF1080 domain-containing protein [Armatimonadetes bacterium]|nr:DUF1080 domain-containing protein [Armatimonadota bacterium]
MTAALTAALLLVPSAADWKPLFDGKSLTGWTRRGGKAAYSVDKGEIVGRTVVGEPNSFLCTDKFYGDFELEFDVKTVATLNSGVQIRSMSVPGYNKGQVHGYQVEVDPSDRAWSGGLYDEGRRGWLQDLSKNERGRKAFKNGQWNHYRVVAEGDRFRIWVNGVSTVDHRDDLTRWGFIGLQVHNHEKAGLEVRWKNLRIKDKGIPSSNPPKGADILIGGSKDLANWQSERNLGQANPWQWVDGAMQGVPGSGDVVTKKAYGDLRLHMEFMTDENGQAGQANGNSGVYMMQSYEVQILNSAPRGPLIDECGAIYSIKAPDTAMAFKAGEWQTYDVWFKAPRWEGDKKVSEGRMTVVHNGTLVHRDVALPRETTAGHPEGPGLRPIRLQDHGHKIRFRNMWAVGKL